MTSLLWMLAWLPQALLAMNGLPKPINDILNSRHFIHILTWEPGPGTPPGVHYDVRVSTVTGTSWVPVVGCEHVQHPLVCNLTEAFSDTGKVYRSKIRALLDAEESEPVIIREFKPIKDTFLDLPLLTVTPCGQDMCVELQPPMEHLRDSYNSLNYKLRIVSNNAEKFEIIKDIKSLERQILKNLASGRRYCVSVCFSPGVVSRESKYSQPVCASTPSHYTAGACRTKKTWPVSFPLEELKKRLTPLQYHVTQERGTESAFTGGFTHHKDEGTYTCVVCGAVLFSSNSKFDSGSGWPSFSDLVKAESVTVSDDFSYGIHRVETTCAQCGAHLGHLFDDGPRPTGKRYCINSASLAFQPKEAGAGGGAGGSPGSSRTEL